MPEVTDVLVSGAGGALGQAILRRLVQQPLRLLALGGRSKPPLARADWQAECVDIADAAALEAIVRRYRPQAVIHCAALVGYGAGEDEQRLAERVNVQGSENLFRAGLASGMRRFVHCSTISVYDPGGRDCDENWPTRPVDHYGTTKLAAERAVSDLAAQHAISAALLRYSGLYSINRRSGAVYNFAAAILRGEPLDVPNGPRRFQFLHVDQAADAAVSAMRHIDATSDQPVAVFNVASRETVTLLELAERLNRLSGRPVRVETVERALAEWPTLSVDKARRVLGWEAAPLDGCLATFLDELKQVLQP